MTTRQLKRIELKRAATQINLVRFGIEDLAIHITAGPTTILCATTAIRHCSLEFADALYEGQVVARCGQVLLPLHPGEAAPVAELLQAKVPRSKAPR